MKVLFVLGFPNPFPGAAWTRISFFAKYFNDKGCKVEIAGIFSPHSLSKVRSKNWKGIKTFNICPNLIVEGILPMFLNIFSSIITLVPLLVILRPDMVVISVPPGEPAVGAYFASRLVRAKVAIDYRDEWEDFAINNSKSRTYTKSYKLLKVFMTNIYKRSDLVVTVTPPLIKSLLLRGIRNVEFTPNGADVDLFKPYDRATIRRKLGLSENDFVIVYSGSIGGYYRLDFVTNVLSKLDSEVRSKIKLLMVGPESNMSEIIGISKKFNLENNVMYLGVKDNKKELAEIISSSDVGIIPYDANLLWKNAYGTKIFEYCACGLPVIATVYDDSILARLIKENGIGLISPPLDEEKLAEAIHRIYKNESFRKIGGKKARVLIEEKFDRNNIAEALLEKLAKIFERAH